MHGRARGQPACCVQVVTVRDQAAVTAAVPLPEESLLFYDQPRPAAPLAHALGEPLS